MKIFPRSRLIIPLVLLSHLSAFAAEQRTSIPLDDSPSLGPDNAPVTMVEFIDFQ